MSNANNYYSKRPQQYHQQQQQQQPQQQQFYDEQQNDLPINVRKNSAGNLVTTFDQRNQRNPISTSLQAKDAPLVLPIVYEPPKEHLTKYEKHLQKHYKNQHKNMHHGPQDYLLWSIANVFIFFILALPALFFSVQTREMKRAQNYERAKYFSKRSLILNILASILGLLGITLAIIFRFALYHLFCSK